MTFIVSTAAPALTTPAISVTNVTPTSVQVNLVSPSTGAPNLVHVLTETNFGASYTPASFPFPVTGLVASTAYNFIVVAMDTAQNIYRSMPSAAVAVSTTGGTLPAQVTGLTATATSSTSVRLNWSPDTGASTYTITQNGSVISTGVVGTVFGVGVVAGATNTFTVAGVNSLGTGPQSTSVTITTAISSTPTLLQLFQNAMGGNAYYTGYHWDQFNSRVFDQYYDKLGSTFPGSTLQYPNLGVLNCTPSGTKTNSNIVPAIIGMWPNTAGMIGDTINSAQTLAIANQVIAAGGIPFFTWDTASPTNAATSLGQGNEWGASGVLIAGSAAQNTLFSYVDSFVTWALQLNGPFVIRFFHEMNLNYPGTGGGNGSWYSTGGTNANRPTNAQFIQAWQLIVNRMISSGLPRSKMVLCYGPSLFSDQFAANDPDSTSGKGQPTYLAANAPYWDIGGPDTYINTAPGNTTTQSAFNTVLANNGVSFFQNYGRPWGFPEFGPGEPSAGTYTADMSLFGVGVQSSFSNHVFGLCWPQTWGLSYQLNSGTGYLNGNKVVVLATMPAYLKTLTSSAPIPAANVGYNTKTFDSIALSTDTPPGPWFPFNKIGSSVSNTYTTRNADGSLTLSYGAGGGSFGGQLGAFNPNAGANGWRGDNGGAAFGGGAYFEIKCAIANGLGPPYANGGFAFWTNDIEWMSNGSTPIYPTGWPANSTWAAANAYNGAHAYVVGNLVAQNGLVYKCETNTTGNAPPALGTYSNTWWALYEQHVEWDFVEADVNPGFYQNGAGNWTIDNASTFNGFEAVGGSAGSVPVIPSNADATQPHYYGMLWVAATPTSQGYCEFYFDRQITATGRISWNYWNPSSPPNPPAPPWNVSTQSTGGLALSIADQRHFALILGGDNNHPTTIYSVQVWQANSANNITS